MMRLRIRNSEKVKRCDGIPKDIIFYLLQWGSCSLSRWILSILVKQQEGRGIGHDIEPSNNI
jgi:hypothetical protein